MNSFVVALTLLSTPAPLDEMRFSLSEIVARADSIVAGHVASRAGSDRKFDFAIQHVLAGTPAKRSLLLENVRVEECPEPPSYRAGTWTILFRCKGVVYTNQWKVDFGTRKELESFVERVRGYQSGAIVDTLRKEIAAGGSKVPFGEVDRLVTDVIAILVKTEDRKGLFEIAHKHAAADGAERAAHALAKLGGRESGALLHALRDGERVPPRIRIAAIAGLGSAGRKWIDEPVFSLLEDARQPHALRLAAVTAVRTAKHRGAKKGLIAIWKNVRNKDRGPKGEPGTPALEGSYLRKAALEGLVELRDPSLFDLFVDVVRTCDNYYGYLQLATSALAEIGDKRALAPLEAALAEHATLERAKGPLRAAIRRLRK